MIAKWRRIIFHPFIIGVLISAIAIFLFARLFPRYAIKIVDEAVLSNNGEVYYFDLNNDGNSEKLNYYHYDKIFRPTLYLYDSDNNFKSLWNFFESPLEGSKIYSGDYNNDNLKEIFVYTQSHDSIFLYVLNPLNDKEFIVNKEFLVKADKLDENFNFYTIGLFNLDSEKNKELLFAVNEENPHVSARIYSFNIQNHQLNSSVELNVSILNQIIVDDINNDNLPEIIIPNKSAEINNDISQSKLIVLDHKLKDLFNPVFFPNNPSQVTVDILNNGSDKFIAVLNSGIDNKNTFNNLMIYNSDGTCIKEIDLNKDSNLALIRIVNSENNLFLFSGKELYKYNSELRLKRKYLINRSTETEFIGCPDFNCDLHKEFVFKNGEKIIIFNDSFKNKASIQINEAGNINLTFLKSQKHSSKLSVQINNKWFLMEFYKNETFLYSHIFYLTAFVFITLIVFLLFNVRQIQLRKNLSFKKYENFLTEVEENIVDEFSEIKDKLENIKNDIDIDSYDKVISKIDDTFESVKSISKRVGKKEFNYKDFRIVLEKLILEKTDKIKIDYFIYPEIWNGVKPEIKEAVFIYTDNLIDFIIEISNDIRLNAQFTKHDNHINIIFEAEKVLISEDKLRKSFLNTIDLITLHGKINVDSSTEYGTIISLNVPLHIPDINGKVENPAIKIIIAEDHDVSLFGLTSLFKMKADIEVVGTAKNGMEVLKILESKETDVVITDISMPGMDGIELSEKLQQEYPKIKVIVFTMYMENWFIEQLVNNGVMAFVSKSSKTNELVNAVHSVFEGNNYYCHQFKSKFGFKGTNGIAHKLDSLTTNEMQIVTYYGENMDKKQIAQKMQINEKTIDSFVANILLKINAGDEEEIVRIAKKQKFISD